MSAKIVSLSWLEQFDRIGKLMPIDHHLQGHGRSPPHHPVEQLRSKHLPPPAQQLPADLLIQSLGIEHQAVEIEDDGPQISWIKHWIGT